MEERPLNEVLEFEEEFWERVMFQAGVRPAHGVGRGAGRHLGWTVLGGLRKGPPPPDRGM